MEYSDFEHAKREAFARILARNALEQPLAAEEPVQLEHEPVEDA